jgi:nicotinate-nucleotide adenylyltransferase
MAAIAALDEPGWTVSDTELERAGPSFTYDTLQAAHDRGFSASQIFFITGADAFADIATWRRYPDVVDLANFVVVSRPGYDIGALAAKLPALAGRMRTAADFRAEDRKPLIYLLQATTPNVSSTAVRERLASGASVGGMLPPLVAGHIQQHRLYSTSARANQLHDEN